MLLRIVAVLPVLLIMLGYSFSAWAGPAPLQVLIQPEGTLTRRTGEAVATGDVNGDGIPDIVVLGGPYFQRARLYLGGSDLQDEPVWTALIGGNRDPAVVVGDLTGDGFDDIVTYARSESAGTGVVAVYYGPSPGRGPFDFSDLRPLPTHPITPSFGSSPVIADVNGDGFADLLLGDPGRTPTSHVNVYFGGPSFDETADFYLEPGIKFVEHSIQVGDVNGDGWIDVLLGTGHLDPGAYVFYGGPLLDPIPDVQIPDPDVSGFGETILAADLNDDGYDDVIVGARFATVGEILNQRQGQVFVYLMGPGADSQADLVLTGTAKEQRLGTSLGTLDFDLDGIDDLLVGAPSSEYYDVPREGGKILLHLGNSSLDDVVDLEILSPADELDYFGYDIASTDNVSGDGYPDIIVCAPNHGAEPRDPVGRDPVGKFYVLSRACPEAEPCIDHFVADPDSVDPGESADLHWIAGAGLSLSIDQGVGAVDAPSGTATVTVDAPPTTYTLMASDGSSSVSRTATVYPPLPPVIEFSASTTTPFGGESITLTVVIENAVSATLEPHFGAISPEGGDFEISVAVPTMFTVTAVGPATSVSASLQIVPRAPSIEQFDLSPDVIVPGDMASLTWSVQGADQVDIAPVGFSTQESSGSVEVQATETTVYELVATNSAGVSTAQTTLEVIPFLIESFTAMPSLVPRGNDLTLAWEVRGSATVELEGVGLQPLAGSLVLQPLETTLFVLRATSGDLEDSRSQLVTVTDPVGLSLSWSDTEIPGVAIPAPLVPFDMYVVAEHAEGGLEGYELTLTHSPCISVIGEELILPGSSNGVAVGASPRHYLVEIPECVSSDLLPLIHLRLLTLNQACVDSGEVSVGPIPWSNFDPPAAGFTSCQGRAEPFVTGAVTTLRLRGPVVPAVVLDLEGAAEATGIRLRWSLSTDLLPRTLVLRRGPGNGSRPMSDLVTVSDGGIQGEFLDENVEGGASYRYRIDAVLEGKAVSSQPVLVSAFAIPARNRLLDSVPNPFNPSTRIRFELARPGDVVLEIFDAAGRSIRRASIAARTAGTHSWTWSGEDDAGAQVGSGVYYVRFTASGVRDVGRLALVR